MDAHPSTPTDASKKTFLERMLSGLKGAASVLEQPQSWGSLHPARQGIVTTEEEIRRDLDSRPFPPALDPEEQVTAAAMKQWVEENPTENPNPNSLAWKAVEAEVRRQFKLLTDADPTVSTAVGEGLTVAEVGIISKFVVAAVEVGSGKQRSVGGDTLNLKTTRLRPFPRAESSNPNSKDPPYDGDGGPWGGGKKKKHRKRTSKKYRPKSRKQSPTRSGRRRSARL